MRIVPVGVQKAICSPKAKALVENTVFAVSAETGLKMIGRPAFIMSDKQADSPEKKRYAAVKEMLYQGTCLGLYLSCVQPMKKVFYKGISKILDKTPDAKAKLTEFNSVNEELKLLKKNKSATPRVLQLEDMLKTNPRMNLGKGARELSAILGSITMLTVVAPELSHFIIHPAMKAFGLEKNQK